MTIDQWLCSKTKLCQMTASTNVSSKYDQDPAAVVIDVQSYPQPSYDPSCIFPTLESYCSTLEEICSRRSNVNMIHQDQTAQKPKLAQAVLQHFADVLSDDILDAVLEETGTQSMKGGGPHHPDANTKIKSTDELAQRLVFEIYKNALEEIQNSEEQSEFQPKVFNKEHPNEKLFLRSSVDHYEEQEEEQKMVVDNKMEVNGSTQNHERPLYDSYYRFQRTGSTTNPNIISGMTQMGSLDYPDAPPSTPLLPELIKSRASFTRKLKGGLAKEFLPSPPPPTPRDQQTGTDKSEFMLRLMQSLSLACYQHASLDEEKTEEQFQSGILDYASRVSADIIQSISTTTSHGTNGEPAVREVQSLANHLAEEIILTSIAEVMENRRANRKTCLHGDKASHFQTDTDRKSQAILLPTSSLHTPSGETVRNLAGRMIDNTIIQAFSELKANERHCVMSKQFPSQMEPMECQTTKAYCSNQTTTKSCNGNPMLESTTSTIEQAFSASVVQDVLECSIKEASKRLIECHQFNSDTLGFSEAPQHIRGIIPNTLCHGIEELQCILLWIAASCMGISLLQIELPDDRNEQQYCSLSEQALVHGWTIGDLMASLLQHGEDIQTASRGRSKISTSLLGHLQLHMLMN